MKKTAMLFLAIAMAVVMAGCGSVKNQAYIDELAANGADKAELEKLIQYEKKNKSLPDGGYVDVTGRTVADVAEERDMTLEEYLSENGLPSDMPGLVSETEANYTMPVSRMAEIYGTDVENLKQMLGLSDDVTEDTEWGVAIGTATVGSMRGENNVESFKETYGLSDDVTADTPWSEVREQVDEHNRQTRLEQNGSESSAE